MINNWDYQYSMFLLMFPKGNRPVSEGAEGEA